jgi:hypothetical protein
VGHVLKELPRALPRMHRAGDYRVSYCDQWRQFARSIRTGTPMESTLHDGRQALAAVLAAARSAVVRRPVGMREAPATMTVPAGKGPAQAAS